MDEIDTELERDEDVCICDEGELCACCAPEGMKLQLELKLSALWARQPAEIRRLASAQDYFTVSALYN